MTLDDDITHSLTQWIPFTWILEPTGGDQPNKNNETDEIQADSGAFKVAKLLIMMYKHFNDIKCSN